MKQLSVDLKGRITGYDTENPVNAVALGRPAESAVNIKMELGTETFI